MNFKLYRHSKSPKNENEIFKKEIVSNSQKRLNANFCKVDDYSNFDFRIKEKNKLAEEEIERKIKENNFKEFILQDKSVAEVIARAQIGVIYF